MPLYRSKDETDPTGSRSRGSTVRDTTASLNSRQTQLEKDTRKRLHKLHDDNELMMALLTEMRTLLNQQPPVKITADGGLLPATGTAPKDHQVRESGNGPSMELPPEVTPTHPAGLLTQLASSNAPTVPVRASAPSHPARRLETLNFYPEENPSRFRQWIGRVLQFQVYYRLPDREAIAELQWYGGDMLDERLRLILTAHPDASLQMVCDGLIQAALPAGAA